MAGGNTFTTGEQILAASTIGYASINVPSGVAPSTPLAGDVFLITGGDSHVQFAVTPSNVQELAYLSDVTASNNSVAAETTRATAAEVVLTGSIASEVTRATGIESGLSASILAETGRATTAEGVITASVTAETGRATAAENTLTSSKANLAGGNTFTTGEQILAASTIGYASINVPSGVAPSTPLAGDVFLITGGDSHVQFAVTPSNVQELAYLSDVTASNNSVATETARATAAEGVLTGSINTEVTRAEGAETTLASSISAEQTRATSAEATLTASVTTETTRATAAENVLTSSKANLAGGNTFTTGEQILAASTTGYASINVPSGVAPATPLAGDVFLITGGDSHVQFAVTPSNVQELAYLSDVTASNNSVATETARATAAEVVLTGSINTEVTRATGIEPGLS